MLRTIPKCILTHSAVLRTVVDTDRWGSPAYTDTPLSKVHVQPVHEFIKTKDDKEIRLNAILFFDCRLSVPSMDWQSLFHSSALEDGQLKVVYNGREYTVYSIDLVPDDEGHLHHVEVGMY